MFYYFIISSVGKWGTIVGEWCSSMGKWGSMAGKSDGTCREIGQRGGKM